jgi:hypothetical protein
MGDLDDSIAHLERFNQTLASLTPQLEGAASDLAAHTASLQTLTDDLQAKLGAARTAVDAIDAEAETFATAAETEAEGVGDFALDDIESALTTLDGSVRELTESVPNEIASRAGSLGPDLEALQSLGFEPLHQMMNSLATAAFGNWAAAAEQSLGGLDEQVDTASRQVATHKARLDDADSWIIHHTEVTAWGPVQIATSAVETGIPATVAEAPLGTDLATLQEALGQQVEVAAQDLRAQLATAVQEVSEVISPRTLGLIDAVGTVVDACEVAEHGAGEAEQEATAAVPRAAALVDLAERIEIAEGELRQIQTVLQAMDAP